MKPPSRATAYAVMALLTAIWGTTWGAVRLTLDGFPPLFGASLRFLLASAVVSVWALSRRHRLAGDRRLRWIWPLQASLTFGLSYGVVYWAEQWVPSGLVAVLFGTFPLFVALLSRLILPQAPSLGVLGWIGVLAGFAGVALIFSEDALLVSGRYGWVIAVTMLSPIAAAFANVAIKRWGAGLGAYALIAAPMALSGAALGLLSAMLEHGQTTRAAIIPALAVVYLAVIGSSVAFSLYFWLLAHRPATELSLIAYGTPVIAVAIGVLAFDEPITTRIVMGASAVVAGVAFVLGSSKAEHLAQDE